MVNRGKIDFLDSHTLFQLLLPEFANILSYILFLPFWQFYLKIYLNAKIYRDNVINWRVQCVLSLRRHWNILIARSGSFLLMTSRKATELKWQILFRKFVRRVTRKMASLFGMEKREVIRIKVKVSMTWSNGQIDVQQTCKCYTSDRPNWVI